MSKLKDNDIKVVIYGCGEYGKRLVEFFQNSYDFPHVIAFIDKTYGGGGIWGFQFIHRKN